MYWWLTLAYYNDVCVGVVCCRKEKDEETAEKYKIYMMTLGVLEPYRGLGLGKKWNGWMDIDSRHDFLGKLLVEHILKEAKTSSDISKVYLHVQVTNTSAVEFYKKNEFEVVKTEKDYYKNIEPRDAFLLSKTI